MATTSAASVPPVPDIPVPVEQILENPGRMDIIERSGINVNLNTFKSNIKHAVVTFREEQETIDGTQSDQLDTAIENFSNLLGDVINEYMLAQSVVVNSITTHPPSTINVTGTALAQTNPLIVIGTALANPTDVTIS